MGLAALHNFDEEGRASVAHGDIKPAQFVRAGGFFKLNDFNEAHLIRKNVTDPSDQNCPLFPPVHTRRRQSPEEYKLKPRTEKVRPQVNARQLRILRALFLTNFVFSFM